jgi:paraquat-inducible protein A
MRTRVFALEMPKIACHDCGLVHDVAYSNVETHCRRCDVTLCERSESWLEKNLALTLTALLLFIASNSLPFLHVELNGVSYQTTLLLGVFAMFFT